jgi:hypothetical protein
MASTATMAKGPRRPPRRPVDNDREETIGRYWLVVLMPIAVAATVAAIMFYLTLPLR